jgi:hypothetical protein
MEARINAQIRGIKLSGESLENRVGVIPRKVFLK